MTVTIRRASEAADFQSFRELLAQYENSLPEDLQIADLEDELEYVRQRYSEPNAALLACAGSRTVGCVGVTVLDPSTAVIKRLYVAPEYRRTGAGRALIVAAIEVARAMRFARIVLDTDRQRLERAYQLYLSLGFTECEPFADAGYQSPTYMELRL